MKITRRASLSALGAAAVLPSLAAWIRADDDLADSGCRITTNVYPWMTFADRQGQALVQHADDLLAAIASTGITGYEPLIDDPSELNGLGDRLRKHSLQMQSLYVNSVLHDAAQVDASIDRVLSIARAARELGTSIIVTNPAPIRWGGAEDKTDVQLRTQAEALDRLGAAVRNLGMTLAYHNHDAELRQGAREFHHMLTGTDPQHVALCLDAHWIYRGCGNSEVAVFDVLSLYQPRIVELHLRQSAQGTWGEVFTMTGDIDYEKLFRRLQAQGQLPHLVLEQAIEAASPAEHTVVEAHQASYRHVRDFLSQAK